MLSTSVRPGEKCNFLYLSSDIEGSYSGALHDSNKERKKKSQNEKWRTAFPISASDDYMFQEMAESRRLKGR